MIGKFVRLHLIGWFCWHAEPMVSEYDALCARLFWLWFLAPWKSPYLTEKCWKIDNTAATLWTREGEHFWCFLLEAAGFVWGVQKCYLKIGLHKIHICPECNILNFMESSSNISWTSWLQIFTVFFFCVCVSLMSGISVEIVWPQINACCFRSPACED